MMVTLELLRKQALSLPGAIEESHFEKTSFRVKKKIFATYDAVYNRATVKLSEKDQDLFSLSDRTVIYPVANSWGKQGWTVIEMAKVREELFIDALNAAYQEVVQKK